MSTCKAEAHCKSRPCRRNQRGHTCSPTLGHIREVNSGKAFWPRSRDRMGVGHHQNRLTPSTVAADLTAGATVWDVFWWPNRIILSGFTVRE